LFQQIDQFAKQLLLMMNFGQNTGKTVMFARFMLVSLFLSMSVHDSRAFTDWNAAVNISWFVPHGHLTC